jgi:hypothetical protein
VNEEVECGALLGIQTPKRFAIFTEVFQCPLNEPADLAFDLFNVLLVFGQSHPANLNRLAYRLVDLTPKNWLMPSLSPESPMEQEEKWVTLLAPYG